MSGFFRALSDTIDYIEKYKEEQNKLTRNEKVYVLECNKLSYLQQRQSLLKKVIKNLKKQNPLEQGRCPTCGQLLPLNIESEYEYLQDVDNTEEELQKTQEKIKKIQSDINSFKNSIEKSEIYIGKNYQILQQLIKENVTYDKWLNNKTNVQLAKNITFKLGQLNQKQKDKQDELSDYKSDEEIQQEREKQSSNFKHKFKKYTNFLGVKELVEDRFTKLYKISSFPSQGTELHKTVMAYHFAFNAMIFNKKSAHRFPFMLDAIFKEDIDSANKSKIIEFISQSKPVDTQLIISIAEDETTQKSVEDYNKEFFNNKANLICLGDRKKERAFLKSYNNEYSTLIEETIDTIYQN